MRALSRTIVVTIALCGVAFTARADSTIKVLVAFGDRLLSQDYQGIAANLQQGANNALTNSLIIGKSFQFIPVSNSVYNDASNYDSHTALTVASSTPCAIPIAKR